MNRLKFNLNVIANLLRSAAGVVAQLFHRLGRGHSRPKPERVAKRWEMPHLSLSAEYRRRALMAGALMVILTSGVCIYIVVMPEATSKVDTIAEEVLGHGVATETLNVLGDGGQVVVVAWESAVEVREFERVVRARFGVNLRAVERVSPSQVDAKTLRLTGVFPKILEKYPAADVIVSFVGLPDLSDEELAQAGGRLPKFVVVTGAAAGLERFFEKKLLTVAIVPRGVYYGPTPEEDRPLTPHEIFTQKYRVLGTGTAASR